MEKKSVPVSRTPVIGEIVSYYHNGTRYGKVETIHPRAKTADILPLGAARKARKGSAREKAGLPQTINVPLSDIGSLSMFVTLEPGESIDDRAEYGDTN